MPNQEADSHRFGRREKFGLTAGLILFFAILFMPTPFGLTEGGQHVLASAILMAILWITEAIPIPVTALLPLVLFPFLKIAPLTEVAPNFANGNIFLFMGGFFLAVSMQKWGLHRRIALQLIRRVGASPQRVILGFMIATAFLSMWISNTATTMMMYPIGLAVVFQLTEKAAPGQDAGVEASMQHFRTALMLAIAYAAGVGGIGTLIGTPPNIIFAAAVTKLYPDAPPVNFSQWLMIGLPLVLIFIPLIWLLLTRVLFRLGKVSWVGGKEVIENELQKLGRMNFPEKVVAWVFSLTAILWITRAGLKIGEFSIPGWATLLNLNGYVNDAAIAMLAATVLFIFPANTSKGEFVLDWQTAVKIPWGILLLFGGGIALADGFRISGLAKWFGQQLALIGHVPVIIMIVFTIIMVALLTEVTSNTATATLFMPVLASVATALKAHPFLFMIPATIAASCAFMLPVATPPNAIVFASGYISIPQMAKAGVLLDLLGILLITLITYFLVIPVFGIAGTPLPAWAH